MSSDTRMLKIFERLAFMNNPLVFTSADFVDQDGQAASPQGAALIANDRSAKVLACLAELRQIVFNGIECSCSIPYPGIDHPFSLVTCSRCRALENIDKMTQVVEGS